MLEKGAFGCIANSQLPIPKQWNFGCEMLMGIYCLREGQTCRTGWDLLKAFRESEINDELIQLDMEEDFEERDTNEAIIDLSDGEGDSEMLDLNESLLDSD